MKRLLLPVLLVPLLALSMGGCAFIWDAGPVWQGLGAAAAALELTKDVDLSPAAVQPGPRPVSTPSWTGVCDPKCPRPEGSR